MVLTKKQFNALSQAEKGKVVRKSRKRVNRAQMAVAPVRNGQGRRRGARRERGGALPRFPTAPRRGRQANQKAGVPGGFGMKGERINIAEQLGTVNGSVAYTVQTSLGVNPGNATMFPLLSRIAANYERYKFENLCFHFKASSAPVAGAQGQGGFVGMSVTNDAKQPAPSTQQIAESMKCSGPEQTQYDQNFQVPGLFWEPVAKLKHFVRQNGIIPGGVDPHEYDCGQFFLWTSQQAAGSGIGEIRITGSVTLYNQILELSTTPPVNFTMAQLVNVAATPVTTTIARTLPLADVTPADGYFNNLVLVNTAGSVVPPIGTYAISWTVIFTMTGNSTNVAAYVTKNAALPAWATPTNGYPTGAYPFQTLSGTEVFQANGTDAFSLWVNATFSTGACTAQGYMTWESI